MTCLLSPLKGVEGESDRGGVNARVGSPVLHLYSPQVGLPSSQGDAVAVAAPRWLRGSLLSFYSRQPANPAPPNNVFKAVFFTVWCLFSVPVVCAAVSRLLGRCVFFPSSSSFFFLMCVLVRLVCTRCHLMLSCRQPGARTVSCRLPSVR